MVRVRHSGLVPHVRRKVSPLRVGFVPLCDYAPLVVAQEQGLFCRYGLNVELVREVGWATLRDKIVHGQLAAAHALAAMPFGATLGIVPTAARGAWVLQHLIPDAARLTSPSFHALVRQVFRPALFESAGQLNPDTLESNANEFESKTEYVPA